MTYAHAPGEFILTRTGRRVDPLALRREDVDVLDVAWALAGESRFSNHARWNFSVAQHSVQMAWAASDLGLGEAVCYQCLLHDAAEAYLTDLSSPVKRRVPEYGAAERRAWVVIARTFRCPEDLDPAVGELDKRALAAELALLFPTLRDDRPAEETGVEPLPGVVEAWPREVAFRRFLTTYATLAPAGAPRVNGLIQEQILAEAAPPPNPYRPPPVPHFSYATQ